MKKLLYVAMLFFVIAMTCGNVEQAEAKTYKAGKFKYTYKKTKKGVWITKITPLSSKGISKLNIPAKIKGKKVVKLGSTEDEKAIDVFDRVSNIFGVLIYDPDGYGEDLIVKPEIYKKVAKIKKIKIPSSVVSVTPKCFFFLQDGKEINIPKGVKKNVVYQFTKPKWKKLKISSKNKKYKVKNACLLSKSGKTMYGIVYKKKKVVIPSSVTKIDAGPYKDMTLAGTWYHESTFSGCETLVIPKSVKNITFLDSNSQMKVKVDSANKYYGSKDGSLYDKKNGELMTLYQTNGIYKIPDGIKVLRYYGFDVFGESCAAKKFIIPASVNEIGDFLRYYTVKNAVCVCYGKVPPILTSKFTRYGDEINLTVYVPKGCKAAYEKAWQVEKGYEDKVKLTFIEQ